MQITALMIVLLAAAPAKKPKAKPPRPAKTAPAAPRDDAPVATPPPLLPEAQPAPAPAPAPAADPKLVEDSVPGRTRIGVFDFKVAGVEPAVGQSLNAVVAEGLDRLGVFKVFTAQAIASLLALERQKQLMGCSESESSSCMAEIAEALGVEYIVTGAVGRLTSGSGNRLQFELSLLDVKHSRRASSVVLESDDESDLVAQTRRSMSRLLDPLLKNRLGFLRLVCSERGALVKVDDQPVGTTPLDARLQLTAIPHTVSLEKEGFITWSKGVTVTLDQTEELNASLAPSPDYAASYESKHKKLRVGAWVSTVLAVAGAGAFAFARLQVNRLFGNPDPEVNRATAQCATFSCHKQRLVDGFETEGAVNHRLEAQALTAQISSFITVGYVALGAGAAAAVASVVFWIIGDNPNRYSDFKATVVPISGSGGAMLQAEVAW